ncbi:MAG TPA: Gfo/Idh/MocA family oxidoreductase [Candidatus Dormibacteraeota bacterium]|nr:Gfo/Idh/MocA family oxidoreductase [Candidatus Dormibacteraeota bacterium]
MIRAAVLGVGTMGRHHARVYHDMPEVELVGVADNNPELAALVASRLGCKSYGNHRELLERERPEAVSVVVPTQSHLEVASDALAAGSHVLVEKPIAATIDEATEIVRAAVAAERMLAIGHIERFNPAVMELKRRLDDGQAGRVFQCHARRLGPFPPRIRDVGVVVDLATHDIDVMRYLTGSRATRVYAETKREINTSNEDMLSGLIRFDSGVLGVLDINWLTPTKIRVLTVTGERGMFRADYLTQDLFFYENAESRNGGWDDLAVLRGVTEGPMVKYSFEKKEPLRQELESFVATIAGDASRIVTGEDGIEALRLALALIRSGQQSQAVEVG